MTSRSTTLFEKNPPEIFNYINRYYKGAFISDIIPEFEDDNTVYYSVGAKLEDASYHLTFDSEGILISNIIEPIRENYFDEYFDND